MLPETMAMVKPRKRLLMMPWTKKSRRESAKMAKNVLLAASEGRYAQKDRSRGQVSSVQWSR